MIRKVAEDHHHTPDDVREYLDTARNIVAELGLRGELLGLGFSKAVDLLSAKQMWHEQVAAGMTIPGQQLHG